MKYGKRIYTSKKYRLCVYTGNDWFSIEYNKRFHVLNLEIFKVWFAIVI